MVDILAIFCGFTVEMDTSSVIRVDSRIYAVSIAVPQEHVPVHMYETQNNTGQK